jgi:predicted nucleic-acid-binding Zn-ribbon protein
MRNGVCPRCGSATVYSQAGGVHVSGGERIYVPTSRIDKAVPFVSFVCTTCGYFENYIADQNKLTEVAQKWQKVPTAPSHT